MIILVVVIENKTHLDIFLKTYTPNNKLEVIKFNFLVLILDIKHGNVQPRQYANT